MPCVVENLFDLFLALCHRQSHSKLVVPKRLESIHLQILRDALITLLAILASRGAFSQNDRGIWLLVRFVRNILCRFV